MTTKTEPRPCSFPGCGRPATQTVSAKRHPTDWEPPWLPYCDPCGDAVYRGERPPVGALVIDNARRIT